MTPLIVFLVAPIVTSVLAVAACIVGGRADDQDDRDEARERHYINRAGVYNHPRSLR